MIKKKATEATERRNNGRRHHWRFSTCVPSPKCPLEERCYPASSVRHFHRLPSHPPRPIRESWTAERAQDASRRTIPLELKRNHTGRLGWMPIRVLGMPVGQLVIESVWPPPRRGAIHLGRHYRSGDTSKPADQSFSFTGRYLVGLRIRLWRTLIIQHGVRVHGWVSGGRAQAKLKRIADTA